jgi:hypothetical protein
MARPYMEGKKLPDEKYALILRVSMREEELDRARQLETDLRKEAKLAEATLEALQQENAQLRAENTKLKQPVEAERAVKEMYPGAHAAPMAEATYPDYYVIRASCIEWAQTLAAGKTPGDAWMNAKNALAARSQTVGSK